ncbi:MAG TPA: hypothetical protein VMV33_17385 [Rhodocyclaceae bacterium]|nr:hypothetical protein [Rhodocyclaceae bacterium]
MPAYDVELSISTTYNGRRIYGTMSIEITADDERHAQSDALAAAAILLDIKSDASVNGSHLVP